jgi:uncharacterized protein YyaL (SSP411 family)
MVNSLANETSPYLRQHAHNPVDWLPWGPQALERARREGKPILLSIGYAACHWCHVMAHESFEDAATAALMNSLYVNIKVDREERPDIDRIYQLAQQMLTGRGGGWPLTMFLLPADQRPFFGGTYFPPESRHGLPAFRDLLTHVATYHSEHAVELREPAAQVVAALERLNAMGDATSDDGIRAVLDTAPIARARAQMQRSFDSDWGGFGGAPKFPHPNFIARLMRDWQATASSEQPDLQALYMASLTLTRMAEGGLYDALGGGFYRYCVDAEWRIPHFEKMLYDNAQLLAAYSEAACATGEVLFRDVANRTADFLLGALRAPDGGFYSSYDADSEGHEGRYYVWERAAVQSLLSAAEYAAFAPRHGLDRPPNFEGEWHLQGAGTQPPDALAESARARLFAVRSQRVAPGLDDKRLTSWNALTIRALAIAARGLERRDCADAALQALQFLREHHWRDGRLLATSAGGAARGMAFLDDYAFLADAILELCTVHFDADALRFGCQLLDVLLEHFGDASAGGFWFTADDHEALITRSRSFSDDALPSGNGVAALALQRYGYLLGETRYLTAAEDCLRTGAAQLARDSLQHATMLGALEEYLHPPEIVILRGGETEIEPWRRQLAKLYAPRRLVFAIPAGAQALPAALAAKAALPDRISAYVCRGSVCSAPLHTLQLLSAELVTQ